MDGAALPEEDTPRWSVEEEMSNQLMSWSLEEASCWVAPFGDTGDQLYGMGLPGQGTKTEKQEDKQVEKSVGDYSAQLSLRYEALHKEQEVEQVKDESQMKLLELKREDAIRQQQVS
ncbi:hypothetical protein Z043_104262, partial [Scleropages formosus]